MSTQVWVILGVEAVLLVLNYIAVVWMIIDVRRRDDQDFVALGQSPKSWRILSLVALIAVGWIFALVYWLVIVRKSDARHAV